MLFRVLRVSDFISEVIFMIWPWFDLEIQNGRRPPSWEKYFLYLFNYLAYGALQYMLFRVLGVSDFKSEVIFMIWPWFDLEIQNGHRQPSWKKYFRKLFNYLSYEALQYMLFRVFGVSDFISEVIFMIWPWFGLQIQNGCQINMSILSFNMVFILRPKFCILCVVL